LNPALQTPGIDLASRDVRTAMVSILWKGGQAIVERPESPVSDEAALRAKTHRQNDHLPPVALAFGGKPSADEHRVS
jgi:hypothetical protein